jgi:hypothetical protein
LAIDKIFLRHQLINHIQEFDFKDVPIRLNIVSLSVSFGFAWCSVWLVFFGLMVCVVCGMSFDPTTPDEISV